MIIKMASPNEEIVFKLLARIGAALDIPIGRSMMLASEDCAEIDDGDPLNPILVSAEQSGIFIKETEFSSVNEAIGFLREGYPIVVAHDDGTFTLIDDTSGRSYRAAEIGDHVKTQSIGRRILKKLVVGDSDKRVFVVRRELECDSLSAASDHHDDGHHEHIPPLRRFMGLLNLEQRDIWTVVLFAFVAGLLTLATPLAVESLVNVVSWGTFIQPIIVLVLILLTCLGLAGVLTVLQTVVVEMIQRRQFVRIVSDLSHRFPRANLASLTGEYPRELANRVFDIMTIQKATAVLLLDGVNIVLTTILGLVLLAFYHPFLLGFDIVLVIAMISITWMLGRGGIRSAIAESITKYRVAHWLQDVISSPSAFKTGGGESLAIQRANLLTSEYISARRKQFRVILRQIIFAISLQVIASTAVLGLGGWLVIQGQLTLGQLVASELVVTVVVGAFAKAGKSLEKFYDVMAGIDKVGHLIDIPTDPRHEIGNVPDGPIPVRWGDLTFARPASQTKVPAATIPAGESVAIFGDDSDGRADLGRSLAGIAKPSGGFVQVGEFDAMLAASGRGDRLVGYAGEPEVFHGTIRENVDLGRVGIGQSRVRAALTSVGLREAVLLLPDALQSSLQTGGYPLTQSQVMQLMIARAIVTQPRVLVINGLLDYLAPDVRDRIWNHLVAPDAPWTLVVTTGDEEIANRCDSRIFIRSTSSVADEAEQ